MDLLNRLTPRKVQVTDPKARFDTTKEACEILATGKSHEVEKHINTLISIFKEEQKTTGEPCICAIYFLRQEGLKNTITRFKDAPGLLANTIALFRVLFDADQENIVRDRQLVENTTEFLHTMQGGVHIDRSCEEDFSQLLFIIASKMKAHPEVVDHWFTILGIARDHQSNSNGGSNHHQNEFPLFYLLLDFVYHDGKVGEYARTGVLYLVDIVSESQALEAWVLSSDLCTLIASGLGALYSQLSRGISRFSNLSSEMPAIVALSDGSGTGNSEGSSSTTVNNKTKSTNRNTSTSPMPAGSPDTYRTNVENFIAYLQFWQDMISYSKSEKLVKRLLSHFDMLFVRQLLYPSLVQSTDKDGEYSVPLLTVLRLILEVLDHNKLSEMILKYLLGHKVQPIDEEQSLEASLLLNDDDGEVLLTLKDIIMTCLESPHEKLQVVALQLLSVLIRKFYPYLVGPMITTIATNQYHSDGDNISEQLCVRELSIIQTIKNDIGCANDGTTLTEQYESDFELKIINHPFPLPKQVKSLLPEERHRMINSMTAAATPPEIEVHGVRPEDKLMRRIYEMLLQFYANSTQVNLALTGILVELGCTAWCTLRSWLLAFDTVDGTKKSKDDKTSRSSILSSSKVLQVLQDLCNQYQHYSVTVDQFDQGIYEFQKSLKLSEDIGDAIHTNNDPNITPEASDNEDKTPSSPTPAARRRIITPVRESLSRLTIAKRRNIPPAQVTSAGDVSSNAALNEARDHLMPQQQVEASSASPPPPLLLSRTSSTSTIASLGPENFKVRLIRPSAETSRSISGSRVPSELEHGTVAVTSSSNDTTAKTGGEKRVKLSQLYANVTVLREFLKEVEALIHVRAWLVD